MSSASGSSAMQAVGGGVAGERERGRLGHAAMVARACYARDMVTDPILIGAAHLLDVVDGTWQDDRRILVRDGRIEAILGPGDPAPEDARPVDSNVPFTLSSTEFTL